MKPKSRDAKHKQTATSMHHHHQQFLTSPKTIPNIHCPLNTLHSWCSSPRYFHPMSPSIIILPLLHFNLVLASCLVLHFLPLGLDSTPFDFFPSLQFSSFLIFHATFFLSPHLIFSSLSVECPSLLFLSFLLIVRTPPLWVRPFHNLLLLRMRRSRDVFCRCLIVWCWSDGCLQNGFCWSRCWGNDMLVARAAVVDCVRYHPVLITIGRALRHVYWPIILVRVVVVDNNRLGRYYLRRHCARIQWRVCQKDKRGIVEEMEWRKSQGEECTNIYDEISWRLYITCSSGKI